MEVCVLRDMSPKAGPVAEEEVHVLLFEPAGTLNTGDIHEERTVEDPQRT